MSLDLAEITAHGFHRSAISATAGKSPLANADGLLDLSWFRSIYPSLAFNDIGVPGEQGFGVGICPAVPAGFTPLPGCTDKASDNYGNYQFSDGSIMVWVPAYYYKYGTGANGLAVNVPGIKPLAAYPDAITAVVDGYVIHRAFYNKGRVQPGVFVDKHQCSNNGGIASSIKNGNPLSSNSVHNPFSGLTGNTTADNFYHGAIKSAKTRNTATRKFFCNTRFIFAALALLSLAHANASTATTYCAWYDATYNFPKGNNNNALKDANDLTVIYTSDGYSNAGKTGSGALFAKTTHNGQNCGIADLNGNMWEINLGLTSNGTNYYLLNTDVDVADITGGNTLATDAWGATGLAAMYTSIGATYGALLASSTIKLFGNAAQVLSEATSGTAWVAAGAGIPLAGGVGGSNQFGSNGLWDYRPNECCVISGGSWSLAGDAGVWTLNLPGVRGNSSSTVGFRSASFL